MIAEAIDMAMKEAKNSENSIMKSEMEQNQGILKIAKNETIETMSAIKKGRCNYQ